MSSWSSQWVVWTVAVALVLGFSVVTLRGMEAKERPLALLSALFFFLVLCGYFFLRPVRDAMGVSRGMGDLRWLFVATSAASLVVVLAFGGVVARTNRRRFIPYWYLFVTACLVGFAGLLIWDAATGGGLIGTDAETALARGIGYSFYVWLSVVNLFMTSVFWAFMVDIFSFDQGKRLFAFIGAGGTLGSIAGSWLTGLASQSAGESPYLPAGLMLTSCAFYVCAVLVMLTIDRRTTRPQPTPTAASPTPAAGSPAPAAASSTPTAASPTSAASSPTPSGDGRSARAATGGSFWEGAKIVATSPYMLGIGLWVVFMAVSNTMIYFAEANLILNATDTFSQRVDSFAYFNFVAQSATLLLQVFVTARLIKRLGIGWTLSILALVTAVGFVGLALWPVLGVMLVFDAVHRATRYAVSRPARETLFSVVSSKAKYKAKPVVDVFLYRGGDAAGAGIDGLLAVFGLGVAALAMTAAPLAGFWIALSVGLAGAQAKKATREAASAQVRAG